MGEAQQVWNTCLDELRRHVPEATWNSCFQSTSAISLDGTDLLVAVPSSLVRDRLEGRWLAQIKDSLTAVGSPEIQVRFETRPDAAGLDNSSAGPDESPAATGDEPPAPEFDDRRQPLVERPSPGPSSPSPSSATASLNPRYTFDAFVTGTSNRFAHAAALAVAETPARSYNPLFIYGVAGLGKTHLLHAVAQYVHQNYPAYRVRYVSCEAFMNDFVDAIRTQGTAAFKRHYRENDVLLIDDIQFMENKEGLQEEFFHTFNQLHGANRQIVISSDRPPRAIATLEDRLRSRFEWGLITDIQPPELETRLAILRKKAEREAHHIPDEVLEFIASHITNNIRELEGALIRVSAFASLNRTPLSAEMAAMVLSDILSQARPRVITARIIIDATASMYDFTEEELCGRSRRRPLVTARQVAMYVCREMTDLSYPAIARSFGGRDHTTVIHAVEKISALMKERRQIYDQVTELIQIIKGSR